MPEKLSGNPSFLPPNGRLFMLFRTFSKKQIYQFLVGNIRFYGNAFEIFQSILFKSKGNLLFQSSRIRILNGIGKIVMPPHLLVIDLSKRSIRILVNKIAYHALILYSTLLGIFLKKSNTSFAQF